MNFVKKNSGFTLTELVITIGLLVIIFTFGSITLIGAARRPAEAGVVDVLVSDIRGQQIKAMTGRSGTFGVNFSTNSYTLTPDNFSVNLPENFSFTSTPQVVFAKGTGETLETMVILKDNQNGKETEIRINKYGATY